jgi:hypothetical protein
LRVLLGLPVLACITTKDFFAFTLVGDSLKKKSGDHSIIITKVQKGEIKTFDILIALSGI